MSRGPPRELCSREPGHWGEVVRACLKQYTQGFSQSSHTQCARSMSLSQRSPAQHQHIQSNTEKLKCIIAHAHADAHRKSSTASTNTDALTKHTRNAEHQQSSPPRLSGKSSRWANSLTRCTCAVAPASHQRQQSLPTPNEQAEAHRLVSPHGLVRP